MFSVSPFCFAAGIAMISSDHVKMARKLLGWSQIELARRAGIGPETLAHFEAGVGRPKARTVNAIRAACECAGIEFPGVNHPVVRLKEHE